MKFRIILYDQKPLKYSKRYSINGETQELAIFKKLKYLRRLFTHKTSCLCSIIVGSETFQLLHTFVRVYANKRFLSIRYWCLPFCEKFVARCHNDAVQAWEVSIIKRAASRRGFPSGNALPRCLR